MYKFLAVGWWIVWFISRFEENNWNCFHSKWQLLTSLSEHNCHFVDLLSSSNSYCLLSLSKITWFISQQLKAWTNGVDLNLLLCINNSKCPYQRLQVALLENQWKQPVSWKIPKRISKRGIVLKVRRGSYNYRFKLYKWLNVATKIVVAKPLNEVHVTSLYFNFSVWYW